MVKTLNSPASIEDFCAPLGRCLLIAQQCEVLVRWLVRHCDVTLTAQESHNVSYAHDRAADGKMLGPMVRALVKALTGDELATNDQAPAVITIRTRVSFAPEHLAVLAERLSELVTLRNDLVHHFLERVDTNEPDKLGRAQRYLDQSLEVLRSHRDYLRALHDSMRAGLLELHTEVARPGLLESLQHLASQDDDTGAGLFAALRAADSALQQQGWTDLEFAAQWIRQHWPEASPSRYGCKTWRQVIRQFPVFELKQEKGSASARGHTWYRCRRAALPA